MQNANLTIELKASYGTIGIAVTFTLHFQGQIWNSLYLVLVDGIIMQFYFVKLVL